MTASRTAASSPRVMARAPLPCPSALLLSLVVIAALPSALVPHLSYKDLEIQKGDIAQKRYGEMILLKDGPEKEKIANALLEYCKLDTLAMVEILKALLKILDSEKN
jgi:hypothetical protein